MNRLILNMVLRDASASKKMRISGNKISPDGLDQEEAQGGDVDVRPGLWLSSFSLVFYCLYFVSSSLHVVLYLFLQLQTLYTEEGAPEVEIDLDEVQSSR